MSCKSRLLNALSALAVTAALACIGGVRADAATYSLSVAPGTIAIGEGNWASIDVSEYATTTSNAPSINLNVVCANPQGISMTATQIFTSARTIVYQLNVAVPTTTPVGTVGPFVVWDAAHTVASNSFYVSVQPATGAWPLIPPVDAINSWIALPTVNFPGNGTRNVDNTFTFATNPSYWQTVKWIQVPPLGNNAPVVVFNLRAPVPCVGLIQVLRNGSVISSSEAAQWSTQWTYRTYIPYAQAGDIVQLYATSQSATNTTNDYFDLYY